MTVRSIYLHQHLFRRILTRFRRLRLSFRRVIYKTKAGTKRRSLRHRATYVMKITKYTEAIELYSMAISYVPSDYVSFSKNVIFSLPPRQSSSLLPLAKQNCACSARFPSCHSIESAIPAGILPSGKVLFPHWRPRKRAHYVLERPGIGLTQR